MVPAQQVNDENIFFPVYTTPLDICNATWVPEHFHCKLLMMSYLQKKANAEWDDTAHTPSLESVVELCLVKQLGVLSLGALL